MPPFTSQYKVGRGYECDLDYVQSSSKTQVAPTKVLTRSPLSAPKDEGVSKYAQASHPYVPDPFCIIQLAISGLRKGGSCAPEDSEIKRY